MRLLSKGRLPMITKWFRKLYMRDSKILHIIGNLGQVEVCSWYARFFVACEYYPPENK